MDVMELKQQVADTGRILLEKELVARTWGNISVRIDEKRFAISPSGLGYENMRADDVPIYDFVAETWEGSRKPSSEKKVHAAAYRTYPDVQFVIHTHQDYATAVGLVGTDDLQMTDEEREILGPVEVAAYGLPGTKKLCANVEAALKKGAKVVLMKHHGAVILGADRDDTIRKAEVLEAVCRRAVRGKLDDGELISATGTIDPKLLNAGTNMDVFATADVLYMAKQGGFKAQLDDMAQMLGGRIRAVKNQNDAILTALNKSDAVLVENVGCVILTEAADDVSALKLLIAKAATAKRYTLACNVNPKLSAFDCKLMRTIYKKKYSKQKEG
ncbi:MAG: class II aldolase/adducin family protein [Lachnospiraceae bacterium]|nr:class II aldolase/adducin family protein [Lachnospiraceae bacterium]